MIKTVNLKIVKWHIWMHAETDSNGQRFPPIGRGSTPDNLTEDFLAGDLELPS